MLVGVLSHIELFSDTYFVSQMTLIFFCLFPRSIIINTAAMLHVFVRYLLYLLLLQCLFPGESPGENKELNRIVCSMTVRVHTGCSAFLFYIPTKLLIQLHIKYKPDYFLYFYILNIYNKI